MIFTAASCGIIPIAHAIDRRDDLAMSNRSECPKCHDVLVAPVFAPANAHSDYLRCIICGHVWALPKGKDEPVHHVTVPYTPLAGQK